MPSKHHLTIIAQERPFDEDRWKELLIAFAYVLHERRQAANTPADSDANTPTPTGTTEPAREQIGGAP